MQDQETIKESLVGTWKLKKIGDIDANGKVIERKYRTEGRLIYAMTSDVFVGLAYFKETGYESNFYSGRFEINASASEITHCVRISSGEARVGQALLRKFRLNDDELILRGENHLGKSVELIWVREF